MVIGIDAIKKIFTHMYTQVEDPGFLVKDHFVKGDVVVLVWEMHYFRKGNKQVISGTTLINLSSDGLIERHRDFWDPAEALYSKLPIIGWLMRWLRSQLSATE